MKTFLEFTNKMRGEIFPAGEAKQLKLAHTAFFKAAMIDIQAWVPCLQQYNTTQYPFCSTHWDDAKTVVSQPPGVIRRIYTIANDDWRDKVFYLSSNFRDINCWSNSLFQADTPLSDKLQQGFYTANKNTDTLYDRARTGIWAIYRHRLYVAPYIQSNEVLVVEWDGVKSDWADSDGVNTTWWTPDVEEAIKYYVSWQHNLFYGDKQVGELFEQKYDEALADMIYACREMMRQREDEVCGDSNVSRYVTQGDLDDDVVPDATTQSVHCFVADWGDIITSGAQPLADVESQVLGLNPSLLILGGDNVYSPNDPTTLFERFAGLKKRFAWGNHDHDYSSDLSTLLPLVEQENNEIYFSIVAGPCQYFFLATDSRAIDLGYTNSTTPINGVQKEWLSSMLALSTARWKIVVGHHAPYTSDVNNTPGNRWMRLDYKGMGADAYIGGHAHNFEHIQVGGFNYFTCGLGGSSIRAFGANTSGTILKQFNSDFAFLEMRATCDRYKVTLVDRHGNEIYDYELTK